MPDLSHWQPAKWLASVEPLGERWQMDVHPPQNGAIGYAPWPQEPKSSEQKLNRDLGQATERDQFEKRLTPSGAGLSVLLRVKEGDHLQ